MTPPSWIDESGRPRPARRCLRGGRDARILRLRIEHLRLVGWRLYKTAEYVNWCGHAQEFVPLPESGGWCRPIPVPGEAG